MPISSLMDVPSQANTRGGKPRFCPFFFAVLPVCLGFPRGGGSHRRPVLIQFPMPVARHETQEKSRHGASEFYFRGCPPSAVRRAGIPGFAWLSSKIKLFFFAWRTSTSIDAVISDFRYPQNGVFRLWHHISLLAEWRCAFLLHQSKRYSILLLLRT